jgi:hypothetical protein
MIRFGNKPIRSIKNQYRGINAHLHSYFQGAHKWNTFHNVHVSDIFKVLSAQLRPLGYVAQIEESLQIRRSDTSLTTPRADIAVYDTDPQRTTQQTQHTQADSLTVAELLDETDEHTYSAVTIHQRLPNFSPGEAVAWLELLSPANKGNTQEAMTYRGKRRTLLDTGLVFVEIDYLHETPATFPKLQDYTAKSHPDAHPYRIVTLDPRPDLQSVPPYIHEFDVDDPIPTVTIPLNAGDAPEFDFSVPYQKTFEEGFYGDTLDYSKFPLNFRRYSATDQTRIALRMLAVIEAAQTGTDLETAPFPLKNLPLDVALKQIEVQLQKG